MPMVERTREMLHDARTASSNHPFLVIGLGMVLIATLTMSVLLVVARRRGISPSEMADFRRWRRRRVVDAYDDEDVEVA